MTWTTRPRFKTSSGLAGIRLGEGPPIILLHGVGLRSEAWNAISELLSSSYTIHAVDLPGHGESLDLSTNTLTLDEYANIIASYLTTFDRPVYLAGHSMGAMIALNIANRFQNSVRSVATLNAIYNRSETAPQAVKARAAALKNISQEQLNNQVTLNRWFGDNPSGKNLAAAQKCKDWLHETKIAQYQKAYEVFANQDGPSETQLIDITIPALFMTGSDEPNSTPDMSISMAKTAPMGKAVIIDGAAHMMPMTHPDHVATELKHHFKG